MMADKEVDRFKVWPTQLDRPQFVDVIDAASREEILRRYPLRRRPYARRPEPRPRMVEAYLFFFEQLKQFFLGADDEPPLAAEYVICDRLDKCFQTLRNALMVAVIDLEKDDDPQVIFETLNARGEPLLPADLLKNYIFFRANRAQLDVEAAYKKYWSRFDDVFWREEVKQGRLTRPRSDLFMQHFLSSRQGQDIPIKHLYVEYRHWVERDSPFQSVAEELATLARQRNDFRRIIFPEKDDIIYDLSVFLDAFDIRTAYPLLLAFMDTGLEDTEWIEISDILESYLLRRAVCNLTTKNYNRMFLALTRNLRKEGFTPERVRTLLLAQRGESVEWPDDNAFRDHRLNKPVYGRLNSPQLVHLFCRLSRTFMSPKSEKVVFEKPPAIEHIMPQSWQPNWPLADGSKGLGFFEMIGMPDADPRVIASQARENTIQTIGNLTILSTELNSAQSNLAWAQKRPEMMKHSLLPINQMLVDQPVWDETTMMKRGEELFEKALCLWGR
jgi:Protein of unknown function (DUF1524)/Protein of unknown function DUF262